MYENEGPCPRIGPNLCQDDPVTQANALALVAALVYDSRTSADAVLGTAPIARSSARFIDVELDSLRRMAVVHGT